MRLTLLITIYLSFAQTSLQESSFGNLSLVGADKDKKSNLKQDKKDIDDISFASSPSDDGGEGGEIKCVENLN